MRWTGVLETHPPSCGMKRITVMQAVLCMLWAPCVCASYFNSSFVVGAPMPHIFHVARKHHKCISRKKSILVSYQYYENISALINIVPWLFLATRIGWSQAEYTFGNGSNLFSDVWIIGDFFFGYKFTTFCEPQAEYHRHCILVFCFTWNKVFIIFQEGKHMFCVLIWTWVLSRTKK